MYPKLGKEQLKAFKLIAAQLPSVNNASTEKHLLTGAEVLELGTVEKIDGEAIDTKKKYWIRMPVLMVSNHYRRLKRAWYKDGREGVQRYIQLINKLAEQHKQETA